MTADHNRAMEFAQILTTSGHPELNETVNLAAAFLEVCAELEREPVASDSDGNDCLRISKSGYSLRVGWGDDKRIVAVAPGSQEQFYRADQQVTEQWLEDAERLCDGWNRAAPVTKADTVPVPREPTWQMCDAGVLAAGRGYMDHEKISSDDAEAIYHAMLAAAEQEGK